MNVYSHDQIKEVTFLSNSKDTGNKYNLPTYVHLVCISNTLSRAHTCIYVHTILYRCKPCMYTCFNTFSCTSTVLVTAIISKSNVISSEPNSN